MSDADRRWLVSQVRAFFLVHIRGYRGALEPHVERLESWDHTAPATCEGGRKIYGPHVCDMVDDFLSTVNPFHWEPEDDPRYEKWDEKQGSWIRCCLRAALDLASEPSTGVVGFTVGDIRRMFRRKRFVPAWLRRGWRNHLGQFVSFDKLRASDGVWL